MCMYVYVDYITYYYTLYLHIINLMHYIAANAKRIFSLYFQSNYRTIMLYYIM